MKKTTSGFTIVELLIVIVVIGILAAISVVAYNSVQVRARDAERISDVNQLHKALELFYAENNYYPAVSDVRDATFRATMLKIPESVVKVPGSTATISYCWANGT
ncbi:type IV pilin protein, partial [Chryseobacterium cucumeris]|uniref:type IV pilin protein n=1 Tax=Chryseobacterium cucumeris TaxID=1813611 RepID=UPI0023F1D5A8